MPKVGDTYTSKINLIVNDTITSYCKSEPEEGDDEKPFKQWLLNKKIYYSNRIANAVITKYKPIERTQTVAYVAIEIYKIKEMYDEQHGTKQTTSDTSNSQDGV